MTPSWTRFDLRTAFLTITLVGLCLGAGTAFDWHFNAILFFWIGALLIWLPAFRRGPQWQARAVVGALFCLIGVALWLFTPDAVGELWQSNKALQQLKRDVLSVPWK